MKTGNPLFVGNEENSWIEKDIVDFYTLYKNNKEPVMDPWGTPLCSA